MEMNILGVDFMSFTAGVLNRPGMTIDCSEKLLGR